MDSRLLATFSRPSSVLGIVLAVACAAQEAPHSSGPRSVVQAAKNPTNLQPATMHESESWGTTEFTQQDDDLFPRPAEPTVETLAPYEPKGRRLLHMYGTMNNQQNELVDYAEALDENLQPAGHAAWIALQGTRGWRVDVNQLATALAEAQRTGGLLNLGLSFGVGTQSYGQASDYSVANTSQFDKRIDEIADLIRVSGVRVLLRIGTEVNGPWKGHHPYMFPKAYRKVVHRFRARRADNVAFVWCVVPHGDPDIFGRDKEGKSRWFPGEEFVDWYGIDVFNRLHFSPLMGRGRAGSDRFFNVTLQLLEHARRVGKPVIIGETTPQNMNVSSAREDPRGEIAEAVWQQWFLPFLAFLDLHPEIKAVTLLPVDWRKTSAWPQWGDARVHRNPKLMARWRNELARSRWMHLPEVIGEDPVGLGPGPTPMPQGQLHKRPPPGQRPSGQRPVRGGR